MAVGLVALLWSLALLAATWVGTRDRALARVDLLPRDAGPQPTRDVDPTAVAAAAAAAVGRAVWTHLLRRRPHDAVSEVRMGWTVAAALIGLVVSPVAGPLLGLAVWLATGARLRQHPRRANAAVADDLPEVVDLLLLAASSGLTPSLAVEAVGRHGRGPIAGALAGAARRAASGDRLADALDEVANLLGEEVRPLVAVVVASQRYGAPMVAGLERLALEVRAQRQRRAEEAAGRIPVRLLFPLVGCVLPAFALLTVAPLLASAFQALRH
jgi:Flp pilus assembly protein TadB